MRDLCPYVCTVEECDQDKQFSTACDYLVHEFIVHDLPARREDLVASIKCPFCGQQKAWGSGPDSRAGHVGRHMEEIAFVVIPQVYEDWDFYSDALSATSFMKERREKMMESRERANKVAKPLSS